MVIEWEIAKKAFCLRNIKWQEVPEMIEICNEIAEEMFEIDKALHAICCLARFETSANFLAMIW
ncbi:hypothetical protein LOAG_16251, partial [Loa loa]